MRTDDFDFDLPEPLIAQHPADQRDASRLLRVTADAITDHRVRDLCDFLKPGDIMVFNDTRVIPARLIGRRGDAKVEILLHRMIPDGRWHAFAKPAKRLKENDTIQFADDFSAHFDRKLEDGTVIVSFAESGAALFDKLKQHGHMPLPPYIKREDTKQDASQYQTVYAARDGAVAAPTAGLHFTPDLLSRIDAMGVHRVSVTLHVGAGTFLPVKADDIRDHQMHAEWAEIRQETADAINAARAQGGRLVCVGTTSLRVIESAADEAGVVHPFCADTSIFIYPGYRFKAVDVLMTNFHLPKSTLFMLVSAFCGLDRMKQAYRHAIDHEYRFFSYGDSSILERAR